MSQPITRMVDWLFRDRSTGRLLFAQFPNAAIWVWGAATGLQVSGVAAAHDDELRWLGRGALLAWGLDELWRGANPFRRILGAAVVGWQLTSLSADLFTS